MRYAIIHNGIVVNVVEIESIDAWQPPAGLITVASNTAGIDWLYDGTNFTAPAVDPAIVRQKFLMSAKIALIATDAVALRCVKAGVAYPPEWQARTTALRSIVNGTDITSTVLPAEPSYPIGT